LVLVPFAFTFPPFRDEASLASGALVLTLLRENLVHRKLSFDLIPRVEALRGKNPQVVAGLLIDRLESTVLSLRSSLNGALDHCGSRIPNPSLSG
jgi:hypothetical protein